MAVRVCDGSEAGLSWLSGFVMAVRLRTPQVH